FSGRYHEISVACERETEVIDVEWGEAVPLERIEARLKARHFGALTVAQSETTTGVLQDVRAIRALCAAHDTACLVDSVTGIGGAEFHFDAWEMDYALTGSQKAMALPPGLAFAAASPAFIAGAAAQPARGLYFDLLEHDEYARKNQTPNTPAVSLFFALDQQLADIQRETMPARWARHLAMRDLVHGWVAQTGATFGVGILARPEVRGPTVTVLTIPERIGTAPLLAALSARGITFGSGYGKLAKTTVRLGHMGDHTVATVQRALDALTDALNELAAR
ncbi:MAG: aminotransferase class V-fold PLP-dependent enzyme, partial [Gemmatimonadaceae bacterium]|nr:aminotransferase class V-fold PLP-dependent enzyme [Gemmatimonadaceae bacterium]